MTTEPLVQIKGIREGLLITAHNGQWDDRKLMLLDMVKERSSFFSGARVCLDVGSTTLRVKEITNLRDQLSDLQVTLWAILSTSEATTNNSKTLGFETSLVQKKETSVQEEFHEKKEDGSEKAVLISRTLRAGYRVEAREHVIVIGDVNPGAEIITTGNIIVWGKLRGSAVAGVQGNNNAVIRALDLKPTQLRIGEVVFPPVNHKGKVFPEEAYIENDECKIEIWNKEKGK